MEHQTGLEMYCIVDEKNKKLRYGYTTGSCAGWRRQAAVRMLLSGEKTEEVALQTPKGILLHLLIEEIQMSREEVVCAVKKDGGDDPDVTHGIFVYARVKKSKEPGVHLDGGIWCGTCDPSGVGTAGGSCGDQSGAQKDDPGKCRAGM